MIYNWLTYPFLYIIFLIFIFYFNNQYKLINLTLDIILINMDKMDFFGYYEYLSDNLYLIIFYY
jgi:hypothetical protein